MNRREQKFESKQTRMIKGLGDALTNKVNEKWIEVELDGL